jgi:hypothetical protein
VARFPQILADAAKRTEPTEEDLLTFRIVKDAVMMSKDRASLRDVDLSGWSDLASSGNVACRATALVAFKALQSTSEQQKIFYKFYLRETNLQVAKAFVEQLGGYNIPETIALLKQFKASSPLAPQLNLLIQQKLTSLQQHTQ